LKTSNDKIILNSVIISEEKMSQNVI